MKKSRNQNFMQAVILISLTLLLISCQTKPEVKPVSLDIPFPVFPNPQGQVYLTAENTVVMPLDYWLLIAEYKIEVDTAEALYKAGK